MMKTVYLDTNVFDHIHKGIDVSETNKLALSSAVREGRLSIVFSYLNLEETISALNPSPTHAMAMLQLIADLSDWQRLVKPADELLTDDIRCYAQGDALSEPYIGIDPTMEANLRALLNWTPNEIGEWGPMVEDIKRGKDEFKSGMIEAKQEMLPHVENLGGCRPSFSEYWTLLAENFAEGFAERAGALDACKRRGINGLLQVRSVRMAVGISLSLSYGHDLDNHSPKIGDSRDLQHAVLAASVADTFVTHDGRLEKLLNRVPMDGFRVSKLQSVLAQIQ